ncbi:MAG: acyltransferase family protein [Acidimicrobiales bacterium]
MPTARSDPAPGARVAGPSRTQAAGGGFRPDVQGLRALAVLLVIADHAGVSGFGGGYVGVDVFFVISGYVITGLLLRETGKGVREGLVDFYCRRIRRIAPAATATLVGTVLAAGLLVGGRVSPGLPGDVRWASLFAANFRLIRTGSNYFIPGLQPSLITQFWSLAVEEQFYLVFPLLVFVVAAVAGPRRRRSTLVLAVGAGMAVSAWWSVHLSAAQPAVAYYSPFTRFWELGLGCLLAAVTAGRAPPRASVGAVLSAAGAGLLVVGLAVLHAGSTYPGWLAWLPCGGAGLLLLGGSSGSRAGVSGLLSLAPLVYLGDISYSLYLTHYAWLNLPAQLLPPLAGWRWRAVELAGTFATAAASYHLLENPIRRSGRLASDRVAVVLLLGVCVAASWTAAEVAGHFLIR